MRLIAINYKFNVNSEIWSSGTPHS